MRDGRLAYAVRSRTTYRYDRHPPHPHPAYAGGEHRPAVPRRRKHHPHAGRAGRPGRVRRYARHRGRGVGLLAQRRSGARPDALRAAPASPLVCHGDAALPAIGTVRRLASTHTSPCPSPCIVHRQSIIHRQSTGSPPADRRHSLPAQSASTQPTGRKAHQPQTKTVMARNRCRFQAITVARS